MGALKSGTTRMFCKSKYLLVRLPLELCSDCPHAVPGSKQRPIVWSGSWAGQCLRMLLIEPTCLILVKASPLAQTGVRCCGWNHLIYPSAKLECKQLNPNLVSGKSFFVVSLNFLRRHIFSTFVREDQKFMIMVQEWSSVGSREFACDVLGRFLWQEEPRGQNPAIQQHLAGHGYRQVLLPGTVSCV